QFQYELRMSCTSAHQQVARKERRAYMWSGELPPRNYSHPVFSCKIFVGGVPWDVSEDALLEAFSPYGRCKVEWPGNEARFARPGQRGGTITRGKVTGYVYMIFDHEHSVRHLLRDCSQEFGSAGEWYFRLKAKRNNTIETRQVQIIPWVVSDASYVEDPGDRLDAKKTVFVGALHGMITAHVLFSIMNELYGKVVFVGIDTDKYKYPIGSGRVTFSSHSSYFRAIECAFLEIKTSKFSKRAVGPFFCRDRACFRYHCGTCWQRRHPAGSPNAAHRYLTRNTPRSNRDPIETINIGNLAVSDVTPGPRSVFHPLSWMLPLSF
uniref:Cytoplasmic polyadenylation element-binding protein 3 n=1 Tax=Pristionchus pacificus TaxID=54126 RepID=A0A2A6CHN8_PRIPA